MILDIRRNFRAQESRDDKGKSLIENADKMFFGIGIPYNEALISRDELYRIGERIAVMAICK